MDIDQSILDADCTLGYGLRIASDLQNAGRLSESVQVYQELAKRFPESWEVRTRHARLSWNQQHRDEAFALANEALKLAPDQPDIHLELSEYLFATGEDEKAEAHLKEALRFRPEDPELHSKTALLSLARGERDAAKSASQAAMALDPKNKVARQILGHFAWQAGELESAVEFILPARRMANPEPDINAALASALYALGSASELEQLPAPKHGGQHFIETVLQALFNWQQGRLEPAAKLIAKAAPLAGRNPEAPRVPAFYEIFLILKEILQRLQEDAALYQGQPEATLFLVGDNHVLPACHLTTAFAGKAHRIQGILVPTLKISHLLSDETGLQKANFVSVLDRLPAQASVMLSAGANDLKYQSALFQQLKEASQEDMASALAEMAADYLDRTQALCRERGLSPSYLLPPVPNVRKRKILSTDREAYHSLSRTFAEELRKAAQARNLTLVDLRSTESSNEAEPREDYYLDSAHCTQKIYLEAFENARNK